MLQEGRNARQEKGRNGEEVTVLSLVLGICPIDKEEFEQGLQKVGVDPFGMGGGEGAWPVDTKSLVQQK